MPEPRLGIDLRLLNQDEVHSSMIYLPIFIQNRPTLPSDRTGDRWSLFAIYDLLEMFLLVQKRGAQCRDEENRLMFSEERSNHTLQCNSCSRRPEILTGVIIPEFQSDLLESSGVEESRHDKSTDPVTTIAPVMSLTSLLPGRNIPPLSQGWILILLTLCWLLGTGSKISPL